MKPVIQLTERDVFGAHPQIPNGIIFPEFEIPECDEFDIDVSQAHKLVKDTDGSMPTCMLVTLYEENPGSQWALSIGMCYLDWTPGDLQTISVQKLLAQKPNKHLHGIWKKTPNFTVGQHIRLSFDLDKTSNAATWMGVVKFR